MSVENDFVAFAAQLNANVISQASYLASSQLPSGFQSGISSSAAFNKVWRQASIIAAMVAQTICDVTGENVIDDGTTATIEGNFIAALRSPGVYLVDTGTTNTMVATMSPAPATLADLLGVPIYIKVAASNTGATTLNLNAFGGIAVTTSSLNALSSAALTAGGIITVIYDGTRFQRISA